MISDDRRLGWDEIEAQLSGVSTKDSSGPLSWDEIEAELEPDVPGKPSAVRSAVGGLLGGTAGVIDAFEAIGSALAPGGGILAGRSAPKDNPLADLSANVRGAQQMVAPPEERGRGNMFTEGVPETLGQMVPGVAAGAINPALGAAVFGAQSGGPAYFEVVGAGGSPEEGMLALVGNAGLAQLERLGAGGMFTRALKKLGGSKLGAKAISNIAAHIAVGGTREVGTETLEQIGHDLIHAGLTGEEVAILDNALATIASPTVWTVGALGAGAEAAAGRQTAPDAPGAKQPTRMAAQRHTGPTPAEQARMAVPLEATGDLAAPAGPGLPYGEVPQLTAGESEILPDATAAALPMAAEAALPAQLGPERPVAEPLVDSHQAQTAGAQAASTIPGPAPEAPAAQPEPQPFGIPEELPAAETPPAAPAAQPAPAAEVPKQEPAKPTPPTPAPEVKASGKAEPTKVPAGYRYAGTHRGDRLAYNKNGSFIVVGEDGSNLGSWPIPSGDGLTGRLRKLSKDDGFEPAEDIAEFVAGERAKTKAESDKEAEAASTAERRRLASDVVRERIRERFHSAKAKWKKGSFSVSAGNGMQSVDGKMSADGLWGVRKVDLGRRSKEGSWEVTHIPSGFRAGKGHHSEAAARAYAQRLSETGTDWTKKEPDLSKARDVARAVANSDVFAPTDAEIDAELAAKPDAPIPETQADAGGTPPPEKPSGGVTEMFAGGPNPFGKFSNTSTAKIKKWAKKWLTSAGDKPRDVRRELEIAEGTANAELIEVGRHAKRLDAAMRGVDKNWRATETAERVDAAFEGDEAALASLPAEAQAAVADMRAQLDRVIRSQVKAGGVIDPKEAPAFAKKILESQGSYSRRSYKAYLDPEWADKVPADVRDSLFRLWQSWAQDMDPADMLDLKRSARQRTSEGEAAFRRRREMSREIAKLRRGDPKRAALVKERSSLRRTAKSYTKEAGAARAEVAGRKALKGKSDEDIQAEMDATLQSAKESTDNPWKAIAAGKLGRKDLSLYKRRKDIPAELRAFLGEVKDPIANYATSVFKIAQNVARHEASANIRKMGLGEFLFEKPTGDATAKLTAEGNKGLAPLDGLYVTPELKAALVEIGPGELPAIIKAAARVNGAIKWGKVIGQPWAFMRNLWGNVPMSIANGHLPSYFKSKEWKAAFGEGDLDTLKRLKRLGIIDDNISTYEWEDAKRAAKATPDEIAKGVLAPGPAGQGIRGAERLFQAADNAPKIRFFLAEEAALVEAGYSPAKAESLAADRTRDLMPTPERMPEALKRFRRQPFLGTFFAFRAEVVRTTANRVRLISEELKSSNPKVRAMGQRRAAGQIVAATMTPALAYAVNMLNGVDSEEDEDKRNFLPPWDKNSRVVWFGDEAEGEYFDLSDLDPFTMGSDPIMRVLAGADPEKATESFIREELDAFVGPSIVTQLAIDFRTGKKRDGTPIDNMTAHILKTIEPGIASSARRVPETGVAGEVGAAFTGVRRYQFDARESLGFDAQRYARLQAEAKSKEGRQSKRDPDEKKRNVEALEQSRKEAFDEIAEKAQAALRLGLSAQEVRLILREVVSAAEVNAIIGGTYRPHKDTKKALRE